MNLPLTQEQSDWLAKQAGKRMVGGVLIKSAGNGNPCLQPFGKGPAGETCRHCAHLSANHCSKTYYKCLLRGVTSGPATDHRVTWPACGKFERKA